MSESIEKYNNCVKRFNNIVKNIGFDKKPYQVAGIKWTIQHELAGRVGGLIADEMGLGKTLLILGTIFSNYQPGDLNLIVLPFALLNQWKKIIETTFKIKPLVYHGSRTKKITLDDLNNHNKSFIVLTTYGMISKRKVLNYKSLLWSVNWKRLVCDEAHHLRNMTNKYYGIKKVNATFKWMMTGTPICNSINDLYTLLDVIGFKSHEYLNPLKLRGILSDYLLRRTKESVGLTDSLPDIHYHYETVNFDNKDEEILAKNIHAKEKNNFSSVMPYISIHRLTDLIRARQVCLSSNMVINSAKKKMKKEGLYEEVDEEVLEKFLKIQGNSKLIAIAKKLKENKNENKKLIFCSFRYEISYLKQALREDFDVDSIDGTKSKKKRENIIKREPTILILQIQTSCEGLNLQNYNEIYVSSPWWNPSIENQAVCRAYRIGQKKDVHVYRFITEFDDIDSIDKVILERQSDKEKVAQQFITVTENFIEFIIKQIEKPNDVCCICHENLDKDLVKFNNCNHVCHHNCANQLMEYKKECPLCRKNFTRLEKVEIKTQEKNKKVKKIKKIKLKKKETPINHTNYSWIKNGRVPIGHTSFSW